MAGLLIPLSAILRDPGGVLRNAGSVKFSGIRQVPQFTLRHNTVSEDVGECALGCSEGTGGFDAVVSRRLDNSGSVLKAPHEAKGFIIFPSAEAISL